MKNIENAINVSIGAERSVELLEIMLRETMEMYPDDDRLPIFTKNILDFNL